MFATAARNVAKSGARMLSTGAARAANNQRVVMGAAGVAAGIAAGVAGYKSECLKIEIDDATAKKLLAALKGGATPTGPRYNELMASPPREHSPPSGPATGPRPGPLAPPPRPLCLREAPCLSLPPRQGPGRRPSDETEGQPEQ